MTPLARTWSLILAAAALLTAPGDALAQPSAGGIGRDAIRVFECDFGEAWDVNYDGWPDAWERHEDAQHPRYVQMKLVDDLDASAERCLAINLDGARARLQSPPMRVASRFSYKVEVKLKTKNLVHSQVIAAIDFLDSRGRRLQTVAADPVVASDDWTTIGIDAVRPESTRTDRAVVRIETRRGVRGDIDGMFCIGSVVVSRLPSMDVTTNSPFNIYKDPRDVVVTCSLSGIGEQDPLIRFQLLDATSAPLDARIGEERLNGKPIGDVSGKVIHQESLRASDIIHGSSVHRVGYEGSTQWRPPLEAFGYGFYHVRVEMVGNRSGVVEDWREITLAVVPPQGEPTPGEFGWSLPTADEPLSFDTLQDLLPETGVSWVKLPVWFERDNPNRGEEILQFVEQLSVKDIETIGLLEEPENAKSRGVGELARSEIAKMLSADPSVWQPVFDHLMTRLSLRIRWWQLGVDHDTSFVGYEELTDKITSIRDELYRFGQDVRVGLGWRWDTPPVEGQPSWEFEQMSLTPALDARQLLEKLTNGPRSAAERWVLIDPTIDPSQHATARDRLNARIRELISQIIVAKWTGVRGIFVANPFSANPKTGEGGLMCTNGTPGDLLLPWRTAAKHLSNAHYVGALQLPGRSLNWVFQQGDTYVMVLWNDTPTNEVLYLGDNVRLVNVWGQSTTPELVEAEPGFRRQVIPVGPMPQFLVGINGPIARWRMAVQLDRDRVPSIFAEDHPNALTASNPFRQGVGGRLRIAVATDDRRGQLGSDAAGRFTSQEWQITNAEGEFSTPPGGVIRHPFAIKLNNAAFGSQPVRLDFDISANEPYRFSVWRNIQIGLGEVEVNLQTHIDENGRLVVKQQMVNHTDKRVNFRCHLTARGRRRQRVQVFQLGPEGDEKTYTYANGDQLIGSELKLRAEEVNGPRVIVHKSIIEY